MLFLDNHTSQLLKVVSSYTKQTQRQQTPQQKDEEAVKREDKGKEEAEEKHLIIKRGKAT